METTKERLKAYLQHKHQSARYFERECGFCNGFINSIRKSISAEKVMVIRKKFPDLNTDWLLYGDGCMLLGQAVCDPKPAPTPEESENAVLVQMYEDMHRKDAETILDLQKRLFIAEHRCQLLQSQLDNKLV